MLKKCNAQKFKIFLGIFKFYYDFPMIIMSIKTNDAQSIFRKKVSMGFNLYIMSGKILFRHTDTVMGRRYTIVIQCFSTEILWH